jgi:hypothetical protein
MPQDATPQSPATPRVKRALARLATDDDPGEVVAEAHDALDSLAATAAFLDADGHERLQAAVRQARASGDDETAARGAAALATLEAAREAARSTPGTTSAPVAEPLWGAGDNPAP